MGKTKLFVAGLLNADFKEVYFIVDVKTKKSRTLIIDNTELKNKINERIKKQFDATVLPYGSQSINQFLPYLINPHSCYKVGNSMLIFFLQAPYFRKFDLRTMDSTVISKKDNWTNTIISASSIGNVNSKEFYLSINSSDERAEIYNGIKQEIGFDYYKFDVQSDELSYCTSVPEGLIDNMHQVGYSSKGFIVSLDMNISLDLNINSINSLHSQEERELYAGATFPKGKVFIYDLQLKEYHIVEPPLCTPAHVEFDPDDNSVFYVSCHNMSKYKGNMVLHGPGAIVKYRYSNSQISLLSTFSDSDFFRITTHKIFQYFGKKYIAVTGYPNYLYIIDAVNMKGLKKIKLFEAEKDIVLEQGLFVCEGNKNAPLYLQVSEEGTDVYLVNNNTCFCVDWINENIEAFKFADVECQVSSHIEIF